MKIDEYCGYLVPEEEKQEAIFNLLEACLQRIAERGPYSADVLNGTQSSYAWHTAKANEYEEGRKRLADGNSILPEYRRVFLEKAAEEREAADKIYEVCNNEVCLGDIYLSLGNSYKQEDINMAMNYYDKAFQIFEKAYRTGIEEGIISANSLVGGHEKEILTSRITDTSEKIKTLKMETAKQEHALLVAVAFRSLLPTNVG